MYINLRKLSYKTDIRNFNAAIYSLYIDSGGDERSIIVCEVCRNSTLNNDAGNCFWTGM